MIKVDNVIKVLKDIPNENEVDKYGPIYIKGGTLLIVNFILPYNFSDGIHAYDPNDNDKIYRFDIDDINKTIEIVAKDPDEWNKRQRRIINLNKLI